MSRHVQKPTKKWRRTEGLDDTQQANSAKAFSSRYHNSFTSLSTTKKERKERKKERQWAWSKNKPSSGTVIAWNCSRMFSFLLVMNAYPFWLKWMTFKSAFSVFYPLVLGQSINRGQRSPFLRIVALCVDVVSLGKLSLFHLAVAASSISMDLQVLAWGPNIIKVNLKMLSFHDSS